MRKLIWLFLIGSAFGQLYPYVPPAPTTASGFTTPVQSCNQGSGTPNVTISVHCVQSNTVGNFLFIGASAGNTMSAISCSDGSNTYTNGTTIGGFGYCYSTLTTGGSLSVTVTITCGCGDGVAYSEEWAHVPSAHDASSTQSTFGSGTTWTSNSVTTTAAHDVIFFWGGNIGGGSATTFSGSGAFTVPTNGYITGGVSFMGYQVATTATSYTPAVTLSVANSGYGAATSFKP